MAQPLIDEKSFWLKCVRVKHSEPDACWNWKRSKNKHGYGRLRFGGLIGVYAHRVAYYLAHPGEIELRSSVHDDCQVLHHCDNGSCCNPKHLYLGNHLQNMQDKAKRGRAPSFKGETHRRAKLTNAEAFDIRWMHDAGATKNALALLYDVSFACIKDVCSKSTYKDP
jgi:hypothetical protein